MRHLLLGRECELRFHRLAADLDAVMNFILAEMGVTDEHCRMLSTKPFFVSCNLLPLFLRIFPNFETDRQVLFEGDALDKLNQIASVCAQQRQISEKQYTDDLMQDMHQVSSVITEVKVEALLSVTSSTVNIITQEALRTFWNSKIGSVFSVPTTTFLKQLSCSLEELRTIPSSEVRGYLTLIEAAITQAQPPRLSRPASISVVASSSVGVNGRISSNSKAKKESVVNCYFLAKISSAVPREWTSLLAVLKMICYHTSHSAKVKMPSLHAAQSQVSCVNPIFIIC